MKTKVKGILLAAIFSVGLMGCATSGGGNSSTTAALTSMVVPVLTQVLQSGNGGLLTSLLGSKFSLGGKTGSEAANLASQVLSAAPAISNVNVLNTTQSNGNTILNTVMDVAGQGQVSSPVVLDQSGKISSLGVLETLLSSGILNK